MSPNPPDPHIYRGRGKKVAIVLALIVLLIGAGFVLANRPGGGMGGALSGPNGQANNR